MGDEKERIESHGGKVVHDGAHNFRVQSKKPGIPALNMSRCLGDLLLHQHSGLTSTPEVSQHKLSQDDEALLICSDGVWEFIKPAEALEIVMAYSPHKAQEAADTLAKQSWDRWIKEESGEVVDDITAVVIYLPAGGIVI